MLDRPRRYLALAACLWSIASGCTLSFDRDRIPDAAAPADAGTGDAGTDAAIARDPCDPSVENVQGVLPEPAPGALPPIGETRVDPTFGTCFRRLLSRAGGQDVSDTWRPSEPFADPSGQRYLMRSVTHAYVVDRELGSLPRFVANEGPTWVRDDHYTAVTSDELVVECRRVASEALCEARHALSTLDPALDAGRAAIRNTSDDAHRLVIGESGDYVIVDVSDPADPQARWTGSADEVRIAPSGRRFVVRVDATTLEVRRFVDGGLLESVAIASATGAARLLDLAAENDWAIVMAEPTGLRYVRSIGGTLTEGQVDGLALTSASSTAAVTLSNGRADAPGRLVAAVDRCLNRDGTACDASGSGLARAYQLALVDITTERPSATAFAWHHNRVRAHGTVWRVPAVSAGMRSVVLNTTWSEAESTTGHFFEFDVPPHLLAD